MLRPRTLLLLPLLLLPACGGSDGLPKDEFVAKAEAVCAKTNAALEDEKEPESPQEIEPYFSRQLKTAKDATEELEQLAADQPDEDQIRTIFLTPLRGQVEELETYLPRIAEAVEQGEQGLSELEEPDLPKADEAAMKEYGFDACLEVAQTG